MPLLTLAITIIGGMIIIYLGTNIVATFSIALLTLSVGVIIGMIGLKIYRNLRNNCDLFNMKKC